MKSRIFAPALFLVIFGTLTLGPALRADGPNGKCKGYNETGTTSLECDVSNPCSLAPVCHIVSEVMTFPNATITSEYCTCDNGVHTHCCAMFRFTTTPQSGPSTTTMLARGDCADQSAICPPGECGMQPVMVPYHMPPVQVAACQVPNPEL